jgi:hypothetical protein
MASVFAIMSGGAPRWAEGPGIPPAALDNRYWAWRPSVHAFGQFARAAAKRYSGTYIPQGQTTPLPRLSFWAIWNEPNFGEDLGPQAINGSTVSVAPGMYRPLLRGQRHGQARLHVPGRPLTDVPAGGAGRNRLQPVGRDQAGLVFH